MDRSKSYAGGGNMQIEPYYGSGGARPDFRSYSYSGGGIGGGRMGGASSYSSYSYQYEYGGAGAGVGAGAVEEVKRSKSKRRWLAPLSDPDLDRKRRVAAYKAYGVEGKVKGSFRKSFRWIKDRYFNLVYGWS